VRQEILAIRFELIDYSLFISNITKITHPPPQTAIMKL
jgi:hypothetical protein